MPRFPNVKLKSLLLKLILDALFYLMHMHVLPTCKHVYHKCACCPQSQKRALDLLALKLPMIVSHHVGAGIQTGSSERTTSTFNCWFISPVQGGTLKSPFKWFRNWVVSLLGMIWFPSWIFFREKKKMFWFVYSKNQSQLSQSWLEQTESINLSPRKSFHTKGRWGFRCFSFSQHVS